MICNDCVHRVYIWAENYDYCPYEDNYNIQDTQHCPHFQPVKEDVEYCQDCIQDKDECPDCYQHDKYKAIDKD